MTNEPGSGGQSPRSPDDHSLAGGCSLAMVLRPGLHYHTVPQHGPVVAGCPIDCLRTVLSLRTLNPLARAYDAPFGPPQTVRDVIELYQQRKLGQIRGLGPRGISEIEAAFVYAGLDITGHGND
jgi:hypothetical protein